VSELGVRSELFGELGEVFGEGRWRVGRLGEAQRSPEVPCMVCFRHQTGAKTGAGHQVFRIGGIQSIGGLPGAATVGTGGCSLTGNYSPGHPGIPPPIFYSCFIYLTYSYFISLLKRRDNKNLGKKKTKKYEPL